MLAQVLVAGALRRAAGGAKATGLTAAVVAAVAGAPVAAAPILFSVGGDRTPGSIQPTVAAFQAALGNPNNGNVAGPLFTGHREINWDGGGPPVDANAPGGTPFNVFLQTRGAQFTTPGTGFVQAPPSGGANGGLAGPIATGGFNNPTYGDIFGVFSLNRDFTPVGSTITEGHFFIPGTNGNTPAEVKGFGAVFTDVDSATSSKIEFFDKNGLLLDSESVPAGTVANKSLSFLGVNFNAGEEIFSVRITSGTNPLASTTNDGGGIDLVVMDDFLFAEPTAVPEPASWALFGAAAVAAMGVRRWRRRDQRSVEGQLPLQPA
jgi:hypothetical protein